LWSAEIRSHDAPITKRPMYRLGTTAVMLHRTPGRLHVRCTGQAAAAVVSELVINASAIGEPGVGRVNPSIVQKRSAGVGCRKIPYTRRLTWRGNSGLVGQCRELIAEARRDCCPELAEPVELAVRSRSEIDVAAVDRSQTLLVSRWGCLRLVTTSATTQGEHGHATASARGGPNRIA
jgi:hypothetical protein